MPVRRHVRVCVYVCVCVIKPQPHSPPVHKPDVLPIRPRAGVKYVCCCCCSMSNPKDIRLCVCVVMRMPPPGFLFSLSTPPSLFRSLHNTHWRMHDAKLSREAFEVYEGTIPVEVCTTGRNCIPTHRYGG